MTDTECLDGITELVKQRLADFKREAPGAASVRDIASLVLSMEKIARLRKIAGGALQPMAPWTAKDAAAARARVDLDIDGFRQRAGFPKEGRPPRRDGGGAVSTPAAGPHSSPW